jgi:aminopeptidase N
VTLPDGSLLSALTIVHDARDEAQTVTLTFAKPLPVGAGASAGATLRLAFTGTLNDKMAGFYRSAYTAPGGERRHMGVTQFEATDARRAFPCWDEPSLKATFSVSLRVPADRTALSNMPPKSTVLASTVADGDKGTTGSSAVQKGPPGWKDVLFERTPLMSTYLVAWVVGEFDVVESATAEGVAVRVWTPPGLAEQGRCANTLPCTHRCARCHSHHRIRACACSFALDVAAKTLSFFTQYFGAAYPLPKMDMARTHDARIYAFTHSCAHHLNLTHASFFLSFFLSAQVAVPDFAAGAMENWGLVTYRTVLALYDPASTGSAVKQQIAYVVCHELAHQWFGNLVTMEWWSDLWLNEGFATWAGWLAVDSLFPEWRVWDQFLVNEQARGLELDGLASSHPIEVEIPDASKVNEIFDAISYAKGASAIHMLVAYMGEASFRQGMRLYVQRHAWGNAATRHLWRALGDASGKPVADLMACWTQQTGA